MATAAVAGAAEAGDGVVGCGAGVWAKARPTETVANAAIAKRNFICC
jgi:hypothetical protein